MPNDIDSLKEILGKMVRTIELLTDETAELVDIVHPPHLAADFQHLAREKSTALVEAAQELRRVAETILDKNHLPPLKEDA